MCRETSNGYKRFVSKANCGLCSISLFNFMCSHGDSGNVKGPVSLSPNPDLIFNGINMDASVGTDVKYQHQPS